MSAADDLRLKCIRLRDELKTATQNLHAAIIEECPYKIGDLVEVEDGARGWVKGKVVRIAPTAFNSEPRPHIAKATSKGFHATQTIYYHKLNRDVRPFSA